MALSYPGDLASQNACITFQAFTRPSVTDSSQSEKIMLPMPEQFANPQSVNWDSSKFGYMGRMLAGGFRDAYQQDGIRDSMSAFADYMSANNDNTWDTVKGHMGINVTTFAGSVVGSAATAGDLAADATGTIPNPYMVKVFRGMDFRTFAYAFKLAPYNAGDCDTINEIIKTFRKFSLPEKAQNDAFLKYPHEFEIEYQWQGAANPYIHKFKRCVLTSVNVDFTGAGMFSVHHNGFPAHIQLNLQFSEIVKLFHDDVEDGY